MIEVIFEEPLASRLEKSRAIKRAKRRLTYDCFNALCRGEKVVCRRGYDVKLSVTDAIRGVCDKTCAICMDFGDKEVS